MRVPEWTAEDLMADELMSIYYEHDRCNLCPVDNAGMCTGDPGQEQDEVCIDNIIRYYRREADRLNRKLKGKTK